MTRHPIVLAIAAVVCIAIGITIWFVAVGEKAAVTNLPGPPQPRYDITGGQEMRPRWDNQEGAGHDAPDH